jgi:hypothetical protein
MSVTLWPSTIRQYYDITSNYNITYYNDILHIYSTVFFFLLFHSFHISKPVVVVVLVAVVVRCAPRIFRWGGADPETIETNLFNFKNYVINIMS